MCFYRITDKKKSPSAKRRYQAKLTKQKLLKNKADQTVVEIVKNDADSIQISPEQDSTNDLDLLLNDTSYSRKGEEKSTLVKKSIEKKVNPTKKKSPRPKYKGYRTNRRYSKMKNKEKKNQVIY